jgi:hypothetical protein
MDVVAFMIQRSRLSARAGCSRASVPKEMHARFPTTILLTMRPLVSIFRKAAATTTTAASLTSASTLQHSTARLCEKGADCAELHAHECPHFSNTGSCFYGEKCRLGHVRRAARMRKATRHSSEVQTPPSDTSKEDRDATTDAEILIGRDEKQTAQNAHLFTQQVDFVSLGADD